MHALPSCRRITTHTFRRMAPALSYEVEGSGPGLVLIHANSTTGRGSWGPVLDGLTAKYTVVMPNLPGSGDSPLPIGPLDADTVADQVVATARAAGLDSFALGGASLGAPLAIRVAARHPDRVTRLITYGGYAKPHPTSRLQLELWLAMLDRKDPDTGKLLVSFCFDDDYLRPLSDPQVAELAARLTAHAAPGTAAQVDLARRLDVRADLPLVSAPTLVIAAALDAHIPPASSQDIAQGIDGALLVGVPGGHGSIAEHPEHTLTAMLNFLDSPL
jgi:pimeloyl-ACP methyl ester carboxylesterase